MLTRFSLFIAICIYCHVTAFANLCKSTYYIDMPAIDGDATPLLQHYIDSACHIKGAVTIRLKTTNYHLYRNSAGQALRYISNTTSQKENPNPVKHFGLWIKNAQDLTIEGNNAQFITHGEMTAFAIEHSCNIRLTGFSVMAADPSVPEMTVIETGNNWLKASVHPLSRYSIADGKLSWEGEGWKFTGGIAQLFSPQTHTTWRCESPLCETTGITETEKGILLFEYPSPPAAQVGEVYQMRHSFRNEVCGFIHRSKNITLDNISLNFLGNFGIVGQYSENITFEHLQCKPLPGSGRTCAGFADFLQISGCKGKIRIADSHFEGAHDDAINVHGTHLKVIGYASPREVNVRFMHEQSYGFAAFEAGDEIEWIETNSLLATHNAKVKRVIPQDNYTVTLLLDRDTPPAIIEQKEMAVENVTWTPEVEICNNYFSQVPTRGILITTRRKVIVSHNEFFRTPMSAILISDDARGWYESGMVRNVTITHNQFIECGQPVIAINPENNIYKGAIHSGISITHNRFLMKENERAIYAHSTDDLTVTNNCFEYIQPQSIEHCIDTTNCRNVEINNNIILSVQN